MRSKREPRLLSPPDRLDDLVEALEKTGTVSPVEGGRTASHGSDVAKMGHQVPAGEGLADGVLGEDAAPWAEHPPEPESGNGSCPGPATYSKPELHVYSDMEELLLLDPVHDVGDEGWPNRL